MSGWTARRFWKASGIRPAGDGWEVTLDDRPIRTPGKLPLIVPTEAMAQALAGEWDAQSEKIDPATMPVTRAANSAIEKVSPQFDDVARMLAEYGGTDLLCYRAEQPEDLVQLQAAAWDPLIDWTATALGAPMRITHGIVPVAQDAAALQRLYAALAGLDNFTLTAVYDLVTIPGSLILGLAVLHGRLGAAEAFELSRVDERWQTEQWGSDEEAAEAAMNRRSAMEAAERFLCLSRRG